MRQIFNRIFKPKTAPQVEAKFQQALTCQQQGQLTQAQILCAEILQVQPDHFAALQLWGEIVLQAEDPQKALELFDKSLEIYPENPACYNNRGLALRELTQFEAALASYDQALALKPDYAKAWRNRGIALRELGQFEAAIASYDQALALKPDYAEAYYNRGNALQELKQFEAAVASYEQATTLKPDYVQAYNNCGLALQELRQFEAAAASYDQALALKPDYAQAYNNRGLALQELKQLEAAVASYDQALALEPCFAEACNNRGNVLRELKQLEAALVSYDQALALEPDYAEACINRGIVLQELKRFEDALASYDQALALKPDDAQACNLRGLALQELKQPEAAVASYDQALAFKPDYAEACYNRGNALQELKQLAAAVASYDQAVALKPGYAEAWYNRGLVFQELKQLEAAVVSYDQALALKPDYVKACILRGIALHGLKQMEAALASYDQALALEPDCAEACNFRGLVLQELKQLEAAVASYDQALALNPDDAEVHYNRGIALYFLKQHQAAVASYDKALAINPDYEFLSGLRLHTKMHLCDWKDAEPQLTELIQKIQGNEKAATPFSVLALSDSLSLQRKAAEIWVTAMYPENPLLGEIEKYPRHEKIRLGYFSMDFRIHPVSFLTAELFELHDRNRFEIIAFSCGVGTKDEMRQRLEGAFDEFIEVRHKSDQEIAEMVRRMEIDIAIDLAGHTADSRTGIFAMRAAPVQVNFLGYPGTMGADYLDYLIADRQLIPEGAEIHYAEKIVYLPSFQPNDRKRKISDRVFTRAELGLPESGFVFCCFNKNYKITASAFAGWMRILRQVEGSVLWLSKSSPATVNNLRQEAVARGVEARRLVFAERLPLPEDHLARQRAADLFIDTLPYNAHTTASDALWAGLPVLTCPGEAFASRVAASLLTAIEMPELITRTPEEYEALAVELATNPERLRAIRQKLERNRLTTPLFDSRLFTRHLEEACAQMYERWHADLPPEHIHVE